MWGRINSPPGAVTEPKGGWGSSWAHGDMLGTHSREVGCQVRAECPTSPSPITMSGLKEAQERGRVQ